MCVRPLNPPLYTPVDPGFNFGIPAILRPAMSIARRLREEGSNTPPGGPKISGLNFDLPGPVAPTARGLLCRRHRRGVPGWKRPPSIGGSSASNGAFLVMGA